MNSGEHRRGASSILRIVVIVVVLVILGIAAFYAVGPLNPVSTSNLSSTQNTNSATSRESSTSTSTPSLQSSASVSLNSTSGFSYSSGSGSSSLSSASNTSKSSATNLSGFQIQDTALAKGVDSSTYQPVSRTNNFSSSDYAAYSWIHFSNVYSPSHNVTWVWVTPFGQNYYAVNGTIPDPGTGKYYQNYYLYSSIYIGNSPPIYLAGAWQVEIFVDGTMVLVQNFTVSSPILTPSEIRSAYDVSPILSSGYEGKGATVAVINSGIDSNFYTDVQSFDQTYGLTSANISVVTPDGTQGTTIEEPAGETTADVEFVHAMAPEAKILLVLVGQGNFIDGFSYVIDHNASDIAVVSPSWYWAGQGASSTIQAENTELSKSVAENITLIAASNDWGSNNSVPWGSIRGQFWTYYLPDSYLMPQYSPYVTAVGGTQLTFSGGSPLEIGWNQSGGGPSNIFTQPSWQSSVPSNGWRDIPDLSLDASCLTPYADYYGGFLNSFCGTSGGAPTLAGIVADIVSAAGHRVGFLNPVLYSIASSDPSSFRDITSGCSGVEVGSSIQTGYCAKAGWDYVTGLGAPDAVKLLQHLSPQIHLVSPTGLEGPNIVESSQLSPLIVIDCSRISRGNLAAGSWLL